MQSDSDLEVVGDSGEMFWVEASILGTYAWALGEDYGAEITLSYDEARQKLYITGNSWSGMNVGIIEEDTIMGVCSDEAMSLS